MDGNTIDFLMTANVEISQLDFDPNNYDCATDQSNSRLTYKTRPGLPGLVLCLLKIQGINIRKSLVQIRRGNETQSALSQLPGSGIARPDLIQIIDHQIFPISAGDDLALFTEIIQ